MQLLLEHGADASVRNLIPRDRGKNKGNHDDLLGAMSVFKATSVMSAKVHQSWRWSKH